MTPPEIEKGIPMPQPRTSPGRPQSSVYAPLAALEVGDSFFIVGKTLKTVKTYLSSKLTKAVRESGRRFVADNGTRDGVAGVRVWRKS